MGRFKEPYQPAPGPARRRPRGGEARTAAEQRLAARAALAYTDASLPSGTSGEARLLAVLCALRVRPTGLAPPPPGITRSLRLHAPAGALAELQEARWLHYLGRPCGGPAVFVPELAGTRGRTRAGQWALHVLSDRRAATLRVSVRLAALTVAAWAEPSGTSHLLEPESAARGCGLSGQAFRHALDEVGAAGLLDSWQLLPNGLVRCSPTVPPPAPGGFELGCGESPQ